MKRDQFQVYLDANPSAKLRDIVSQMLYDEIVSLCIAPGTKLNATALPPPSAYHARLLPKQ